MGNPEQSALPQAGEDLFGRYGCAVTLACAAVLMCGIAAIDKLTGYDLQLGILHLIPIAIATWAGGRAWGLAFSVVAIVLWLAIFRAAHHYGTDLYYYWDAVVLFGTFVLFTVLMARLHEELRASDSRFVNVLERLDAPVYVADPQRKEVLYGNQRFRDTLAASSYEALAQCRAKECALSWPDGRRVLLRILSEN
jgi:PAS domain-containing protein